MMFVPFRFHSLSVPFLIVLHLLSILITPSRCQLDEEDMNSEVTTPILSSRCPATFIEWKDKCYFYVQKPMTFDDSVEYCKDAFNGTLAVMSSHNQQRFINDFLFGTLKLFTPVWIGLRGGKMRDIKSSKNSHATHEGENDNSYSINSYNSKNSKDDDERPVTMAWVDGTKFEFENWAPGEPLYETESKDLPQTKSGSHNCVSLGAVLDTTGKWQITNCILDYGPLCQVDSDQDQDTVLIPGVVNNDVTDQGSSGEISDGNTSIVSLNWILIASIIVLLMVSLLLVLFGDYSGLLERLRYIR